MKYLTEFRNGEIAQRMAREIAAVQKLVESEALKLIEGHLLKGPRRGAKPEASDAGAEADIVQAA